jgi:hypothetical protein
MARDPQPRGFIVNVYGWGDARFVAISAAKARAMAYRALCEAAGRRDFLSFLMNSRIRRSRPDEDARP